MSENHALDSDGNLKDADDMEFTFSASEDVPIKRKAAAHCGAEPERPVKRMSDITISEQCVSHVTGSRRENAGSRMLTAIHNDQRDSDGEVISKFRDGRVKRKRTARSGKKITYEG